MKKLDLIIKILHIVTVMGAYAAFFEILLKVIRVVLSLLGY